MQIQEILKKYPNNWSLLVSVWYIHLDLQNFSSINFNLKLNEKKTIFNSNHNFLLLLSAAEKNDEVSDKIRDLKGSPKSGHKFKEALGDVGKYKFVFIQPNLHK